MATVAESMSEFKSDVDVNNLPDRISQAVLSRARRQPSHPCLVDSERTLDYAGLVSAIEECKTFLTILGWFGTVRLALLCFICLGRD